MPTPISTEAVHALTIEPHADGTYDPTAHDLSTACTVTLSISYQLTTTREQIDASGDNQAGTNFRCIELIHPSKADGGATNSFAILLFSDHLQQQ